MPYLTDGHSTTITFAADGTIELKEISVTPPGVDGGGAIDITTMDNTTWRTKAAKSLADITDGSFTAAYDPVVYSDIVTNLINKNGSITVNFSDGSNVVFKGYLNTFTPNEVSEGERPTAACTIVITNVDETDGSETAPVYTAPVV